MVPPSVAATWAGSVYGNTPVAQRETAGSNPAPPSSSAWDTLRVAFFRKAGRLP